MDTHDNRHELDAIRSALRAEEFPVTREALYQTLEDLVLHDEAGVEHEVRDLLADTGREEYETAEQVLVDIEERVAGPRSPAAAGGMSLSTSRPEGDSPLVEAGDIEHDGAGEVPHGPGRPPDDE